MKKVLVLLIFLVAGGPVWASTSAKFSLSTWNNADVSYKVSSAFYLKTIPILDSDSDGLSDTYEITHGTDPYDSDTDDDGLDDFAEIYLHGSNPLKGDSDSDGLSDLLEVGTYNTDPNDADSDDDGLTDAEEVNVYRTNPNKADSDDDGFTDSEKSLVLSLSFSGKELTPWNKIGRLKEKGFLIIDTLLSGTNSASATVILYEKDRVRGSSYSSFPASVAWVHNERGDLAADVAVEIAPGDILNMTLLGKRRNDRVSGRVRTITMRGSFYFLSDDIGELDNLSEGKVSVRFNRTFSGQQDGSVPVIQWLQSKGYAEAR